MCPYPIEHSINLIVTYTLAESLCILPGEEVRSTRADCFGLASVTARDAAQAHPWSLSQ